MLNSYRLVRDCFELSSDEEMFGRGYLIEARKTLLEGHHEQLQRADRKMAAPFGSPSTIR